MPMSENPASRPPHRERDAALRTQDAQQLTDRSGRIGHVHQSKRTQGGVEGRVGKLEGYGVHPIEGMWLAAAVDRLRRE